MIKFIIAIICIVVIFSDIIDNWKLKRDINKALKQDDILDLREKLNKICDEDS